MDPLVETWLINCRINRFLMDAIQDEHWATPLAKGKAVPSQFAHIHSVRLMWLKASAPDLFESQTKLETTASKAEIGAALDSSSEAMRELISRSIAAGGRVKNFKPHVQAFVAYMIAHESDHRTQVELALRQAGVPVSDKVGYGLWEWGVR